MFDSLKKNPAYPFVAPFVLFMIFLATEGIHPSAVYLIYPIKTLAVGALILCLWQRLPVFSLNSPFLSILTGIAVFILWVGVGPLITLDFFKQLAGFASSPDTSTTPTGFNPFLFEDKNIAWGLISFRILGASLVVPIMEELFWRGFLMRYLIKEEFEEISMGTYTHLSFWITTFFFASIHGNLIPVALITGLFYGFLFIRTKSLGNVMLAHGVTNLLLGIYVVYTGKWAFW